MPFNECMLFTFINLLDVAMPVKLATGRHHFTLPASLYLLKFIMSGLLCKACEADGAFPP
jgi:hypothetical protein